MDQLYTEFEVSHVKPLSDASWNLISGPEATSSKKKKTYRLKIQSYQIEGDNIVFFTIAPNVQ